MIERKFNFQEIHRKISEGFKAACSSFAAAIEDSAFRDIASDETKLKPVCRFIFELDKSSDLKPKKIKEQSQTIFNTVLSKEAALINNLSDKIHNNLK